MTGEKEETEAERENLCFSMSSVISSAYCASVSEPTESTSDFTFPIFMSKDKSGVQPWGEQKFPCKHSCCFQGYKET